jgi:hypothetical protein
MCYAGLVSTLMEQRGLNPGFGGILRDHCGHWVEGFSKYLW